MSLKHPIALGVWLALLAPLHADDPSSTPPPSLAEMDQAARDWLNSEGSAAFGKWLTQQLEQDPNQPEWLVMFADILQGSRLGATDGWFKKAVAQTRYPAKEMVARHDRDGNGRIEPAELGASEADFARLDRDKDGTITEKDLTWREHALAMSPGAMLYYEADDDSDGRVTREELDALFQRADSDGQGFLSLDDLRALLPMPSMGPPSGSSRQPAEPSKATLVKGLFQQEIGSLKPGPAVNDAAPGFTLKNAGGDGEVSLASQIGQKPVVLVFGNITCGPFRGQAGNVEKLYRRYKDRANFLMIYVREAHPTDGWKMASNERKHVEYAQPRTFDERLGVAQTCQRKLGFDMPFLVDTIDDTVGATYSGMPSRLYVIDPAGKVAYKSGRGPFGFKPLEAEQALIWTLLDDATPAAAATASTGASADNP
jgi:Ca2+-binding EF-hand superfamily protein